MILLIDNYDSFTYNLYHYLIQAGADKILVSRNDKITIDQISQLKPEAIVLSPGPCTPSDAGICIDAILHFQGKIPLFGVCLGHQAIGQAFGGKIVKTYPMHGKISEIYHGGENLFRDLPSPFKATRYHSLIIERESCPQNFVITAETSSAEGSIIMGIADQSKKIFAVQFHPESIATEHGHQMIRNFLDQI